MLTTDFRCTAPAKDLDSGHHVRRSQAHSDLLVEEFEFGMLWDEYGLVGDIAVRIFYLLHYCVLSTVPFTYMSVPLGCLLIPFADTCTMCGST